MSPGLDDIDGTNFPAKAGLLSVRFTDDDVEVLSRDLFHEDEHESPLDTAHALKKSCQDDFLDREFVVVCNERANFLRWKRLMERVGIEGTYEGYLETSS